MIQRRTFLVQIMGHFWMIRRHVKVMGQTVGFLAAFGSVCRRQDIIILNCVYDISRTQGGYDDMAVTKLVRPYVIKSNYSPNILTERRSNEEPRVVLH